jgi:hypothetical protein
MPTIDRAYRARCEMLRAIFGSEDTNKPKVSSRKLTERLFDALFGRG